MSRPELELVGVGSVSGTLDAARAAQNTLQVLDLFGAPSVPVAVGPRDFSTRAYTGGAPDVHGANGIGDVVLPDTERTLDPRGSVQLLVDLARRHRGALRVLAIGPLTDLAAALEHEPEAADGVFAAPWAVTVLPADAARRQRLEDDDLAALLEDTSPVVRTVGRMLGVYGDLYRGVYGRRLAVLYDPLAAALLTDLVQVTGELEQPVVVVTGDGAERGRTIAGAAGDHDDVRDRRPCRIVLATEPAFAPVLVDALRSLG